MTLWQATVLGVVQGLTEFLPISSIAHMRVVAALCGWQDPGAAFSAVVQLVAYFAVILYFWRDYVQFGRGALHGVGTDEGRLGWMIVVATVPIGVLGLLFHKHIEHSWRSLYVISAALIGLALVLAWAEGTERRRKQRGENLRELHQLGWRDAIVVGCFQALALVPGASRSGSTITGGLFLGMKRDTAARFSFLMSPLPVFAAGVFELRKLQFASSADVSPLVTASVVAFVVGYGAVAFLLGYLRKHTTWLFIIYRLALGALLLALLYVGKLTP
ncbi:MAG TPA: undecaprenyl-diphosphatase UppP [Verrucomicrobiae bacterium]|nr:undecaprenyl-diphosphatase UppP [Verrucomicrobiae bacterium]